jgi:hypothetical protein
VPPACPLSYPATLTPDMKTESQIILEIKSLQAELKLLNPNGDWIAFKRKLDQLDNTVRELNALGNYTYIIS